MLAVGEVMSFFWPLELDGSYAVLLVCEDVYHGNCLTNAVISTEDMSVLNFNTTIDYTDLFAVRWWQLPFRKRIVRRRLTKYLPIDPPTLPPPTAIDDSAPAGAGENRGAPEAHSSQ